MLKRKLQRFVGLLCLAFLTAACSHPTAEGGPIPVTGDLIAPALTSGPAGSASMGFRDPIGLASDSAGNIYVADSGNSAIKRVAPDGTVSTIVSHLDEPTGVAVGADGSVYIAEYGKGRIDKFSSGQLTVFSPTSANNITIDNANNLYVTSSDHNIYQILSSGQVTEIPGGGLDNYTGISIDTKGKLWYVAALPVGSDRLVFSFNANSTGKLRHFVGPFKDWQKHRPWGISAGPSGNIYVADHQAGNIWLLKDGKFTVFASGIGQPKGVAVDPSGNVYAVDRATDRLVKFAPSSLETIAR
jgi:sugar lactone lactonase YvrE